MRKIIVCFIIAMVLLMNIGVFADENSVNVSQNEEVDETTRQEISQKVNEIANPPEISNEVQKYVEKFVIKRGIKADDINEVKKVYFEDLPKEVNIENVNDANLAIYEVSYNETDSQIGEENVPKKVFVVTYSVEKLRAQGDLIIAHDERQFLDFGFSGEMPLEGGFLKTATGVETSLENGYVMMRKGSITGISTSLDVLKNSEGEDIEIIIYKNGEPIEFGNMIDGSTIGAKKDYDVQSKEVVTFEQGDVISAYAKAQGNAVWKDVITIIEITTIN